MPRPLAPKGGNDKVYTPPELARKIVQHYQPRGRIMEPCRGEGAFTNAVLETGQQCSWCELDDGIDFLRVEGHWDWIVTNPPWSQFRPFLRRAMGTADNIVFLSLINAFFMRARVEDMRYYGFGIVEIAMLETPPKPWPQTGFQLGATYIKRGHTGATVIRAI